jgi:aminoglycoside 6-adenylyltransferase
LSNPPSGSGGGRPARRLRLITDFLIGVPYVAKSLLRGQPVPAEWVLNFDMRFDYLVPLLEWHVECDHDWSLKTGSLGKGLEAHLPGDTWRETGTHLHGCRPQGELWEALFEMIALFDRLARELQVFSATPILRISSTA